MAASRTRLLRSLAAAAAAWSLLIGLTGPANADNAREESRAAFRRGVSLAQGGDYRSARAAFLEAYRLFPHPSILLNLGIARWKVGDYAAAEQDLARFLSDDGGASQEDVASARAALSAVRTRLGTVRVRVAPEGARATLDGQPVALVPGELADVRVVAGEHVLETQAEGFVARRERVVVAAARVTVVDVRLSPEGSARVDGDGEVAAPNGAQGMSARHVVGWSLVGTAGAAGVVGLLAGLRAQALAHEYNTAPAGSQDPRTRTDGVLLRSTADISFALGLVSGVVGAYLLLSPDPSKPSVSGVIGPTFLGLRAHF